MASTAGDDPVVPNPTYLGNIAAFFEQIDIDHMGSKGIDLGSYAGVKKNALRIYLHTGPDGDMPPEADRKWSANKHQTFKNWIMNNYPMGVQAAAPAASFVAAAAPPARVRRNIESLSPDEVALLATAFRGLMARDGDSNDPTSYFSLAGVHGLPQTYCLHHEGRYNPWHRVYLKVFEDALRSVDGCSELTLPYWDITRPLPATLQQAPFDSYTLPRDPGATADPPVSGYFPLTTSRNDPGTIRNNMTNYGVYEDFDTANSQATWGAYNGFGFQKFTIQGHDGGHVAIGTTMADQNIASFDPVFWFYHCNLDRLWLQWQANVNALTLPGFNKTLTAGNDWPSPPFDVLPPYDPTAGDTIAYGIGYEQTGEESVASPALENTLGSIDAGRSFSIKSSAPVSVRVKDIARLNIPGSFIVHLLADGEPVASRGFFQPKTPRNCDGCAKLPLVNIDFRVDQAAIVDKQLTVALEVPAHVEEGTGFPLSQAGSPTINARLLLDES